MKRLVMALFGFLIAGCYSIDEIEKIKPSNNFIANKTLEEYSNCIRLEWGIQIAGIQEMDIPDGKRFFKADMGNVGFLINIRKLDSSQVKVESYIPSSSWAIVPKRLKEAAEKCGI